MVTRQPAPEPVEQPREKTIMIGGKDYLVSTAVVKTDADVHRALGVHVLIERLRELSRDRDALVAARGLAGATGGTETLAELDAKILDLTRYLP